MSRRLSPRQAQVVAMIVADPETTAKEIADQLGITRHTAQRHVTNTYIRLHVHNRTQLVLWAMRAAAARARYGWLGPLVVEERRGHSDQCGCSVCFIRGRQDRRQPAA